MKKVLRCLLVLAFLLGIASYSWSMTITSPIAEGKVGEEYGSGFAVMGLYSTATVDFYISSGSLPPGLKMEDNPPYTALLKGIPTKSGVYPFEVTAIARSRTTYAEIDTATANFTITITDSDSTGGSSGGESSSGSGGNTGDVGGGDNPGSSGGKVEGNTGSTGSSGGGCEVGVGIFAFMIVGAGLIRKFR